MSKNIRIMTRRKQIFEIVKKHLYKGLLGNINLDDEILLLTDEILALPLDVPSDEGIEKWANSEHSYLSYTNRKFLKDGARIMKDEILRRNETL